MKNNCRRMLLRPCSKIKNPQQHAAVARDDHLHRGCWHICHWLVSIVLAGCHRAKGKHKCENAQEFHRSSIYGDFLQVASACPEGLSFYLCKCMASDPSVSQGSAPGQPGISPTWSNSSKDGVGTAYAVSSRVWFTLAQGIVTEAYYPTIDRPQIRDAQFLISDGATFFHEEKRDLAGVVDRIEAESLGYRVTSVDPKGRYRLEKEIISDPHSACVLVHARLIPADGWADKLQVYFLLAPH